MNTEPLKELTIETYQQVMEEFYRFITDIEFNVPPTIEQFAKHGYSMDEHFMNFAFHNEVIPSRVQEALHKYKACFSENIAHKSIKAFFKETLIEDEPYPEAYVQWMLFYYEDFALSLNRKKFIYALNSIYGSNQQMAFGLMLLLKFRPLKKDFKYMGDELKKAYSSIQLNDSLNNKLTSNKKEAKTKI